MFDAAIEYLKNYRDKREEALANKSKQRWFTSDLQTLNELFTDKFDSKVENSTWSETYESGTDVVKTQGALLKIAMLAGYRHDLRAQFAVGAAHDAKSPLDFDRHAVGELRAATFRLGLLKMTAQVREQGVTTI